MGFATLLSTSNCSTLLIAPPAWGKTRKLVEWFALSSKKILIYISPLRALADEVAEVFSCYDVINYRLPSDLQKLSGEKQVVVITPERCGDVFLDWLAQQSKTVVFMDEFHLFFYWRSFRPKMWQALEGISSSSETLFAVSATISNEIKEEWSILSSLNFRDNFLIDLGNYTLKKYPQHIYYWDIDMMSLVNYLLWRGRDRTILCFCRYRQEVRNWCARCQAKGIIALGCVGGETTQFREQLQKMSKPPHIIFATTAISHGVNLPIISDVIFCYVENKRDYFIQMVARAGRRGESYFVWLPNRVNTMSKFSYWKWRLIWLLIAFLLS